MNPYSFAMLDHCIVLAEKKLPGLKIRWDLTYTKKIRIYSSARELSTNYLNLFEAIHWIVSAYNLREIRAILEKRTYSTSFGIIPDKSWKWDRVGTEDIKQIILKIYSFGSFSMSNAEKVEELLLELKTSKACTPAECHSFSEDLYYAVQKEADNAKTAHMHHSLEKYAKFIRIKTKDL